jgi:transglutaminase-like putative cysteine protease
MHFAIRFLTEYRYDTPVTDNLNALRVRPATTSTQRCDEFHTRIEPEARVSRHLDYFGTEVIEFGIPTVHEQLTIDMRARVVTSLAPDQPAIAGLEHLHDALRADSPLETLELLCELIPDRFEYRPGVTYVGSTVNDLLEMGAGVCQDFVHLSLVLLRRRGIAARYVSGYLWAAPEDHGADSVEVDTHAWLEALLPGTEGHGEPVWVSADPTNRRLVDETHVKIGHGRFYSDVPPVKGLYMGGASSELNAAVTMSRLDPQTSARA